MFEVGFIEYEASGADALVDMKYPKAWKTADPSLYKFPE